MSLELAHTGTITHASSRLISSYVYAHILHNGTFRQYYRSSQQPDLSGPNLDSLTYSSIFGDCRTLLTFNGAHACEEKFTEEHHIFMFLMGSRPSIWNQPIRSQMGANVKKHRDVIIVS